VQSNEQMRSKPYELSERNNVVTPALAQWVRTALAAAPVGLGRKHAMMSIIQ
jgi:hypothetical protein